MKASSETHDGPNAAVAEVISLESRLLDASVRRSPQEVLALLHPEFTEFGASGRRWTAVDVAASMAAAAEQGERVEGRNFTGYRLAEEVVLLTYEAHGPGRVSLRSSVWTHCPGSWLLRFHQGTLSEL